MNRATIWASVCAVLVCGGCLNPFNREPDGRHRSNLKDITFNRRHYDRAAHADTNPVMALARELTMIEDDLRRDGTITVKQPDVWGDGNLMYFLQEYDKLIAHRTTQFAENLQAYIVRSDNAELQSTTSLAAALGDKGGTNTSSASAVAATPTLPPAETIDLDKIAIFDLIGKSKAAATPATPNIGVEPTELARQHSTYIDVCQALRRRHMGDDNTLAAGYGLYKFRIPVSVLPGRETTEGHSGVVTLRAQLRVDEANLHYTYPKLVIADVVDTLTPVILNDWGKKDKQQELLEEAKTLQAAIVDIAAKMKVDNGDEKAENRKKATVALAGLIKARVDSLKGERLSKNAVEDLGQLVSKTACHLHIISDPNHKDHDKIVQDLTTDWSIPAKVHSFGPQGPQLEVSITEVDKVYGRQSITALRTAAQQAMSILYPGGGKPKVQELREYLFKYLGQVNGILEKNNLYSDAAAATIIAKAACHVSAGQYDALAGDRTSWLGLPLQPQCNDESGGIQCNLHQVGWLLALQAGILDQNLRKIVEDLQLKGKLDGRCADVLNVPSFHFFDFQRHPGLQPDVHREARLALWQAIVTLEFPLHVFTLDSQVEEQNVFDAFSRRREMQLALAYSVAKGRFNMSQKLAYSRQLALDEVALALNRTVVGFSHGEDTFGWYFYPRVQTPPTERTNIGAFARMLWATGPTERYDLRHRNLEPGIRECEVLIAMPSFVTTVAFDVTTNWEKLARPGVTKRSYEEMVAQGGRIAQLKDSLGATDEDPCYRPGDVQRLVSRIDQLEQMLGLQTYMVNVPYQFEQSGSDLFDTGDLHLRPIVTGYYGMSVLTELPGGENKTEASFFLAGKNFHPTLTHVIVGGSEIHSIPNGAEPLVDVEVINRSLLRVKVKSLNPALSNGQGFEVRVGTPSGISGPLTINPPPPSGDPKGWSFDKPPTLLATLADVCCAGQKSSFAFAGDLPDNLDVVADLSVPLPKEMPATFIGELTAAKKDGTVVKFGRNLKKKIVLEQLEINQAGKAFSIPFKSTADQNNLQRIIEKALGDDANPPRSGGDPFVVKLQGYVAFNRYPVEATLNSVEIHVSPCVCPKALPADRADAPAVQGPDMKPAPSPMPEAAPPGRLPAPSRDAPKKPAPNLLQMLHLPHKPGK